MIYFDGGSRLPTEWQVPGSIAFITQSLIARIPVMISATILQDFSKLQYDISYFLICFYSSNLFITLVLIIEKIAVNVDIWLIAGNSLDH